MVDINISRVNGEITIKGPGREATEVFNSVSSQLSKLSATKAEENSLKVLEKIPKWSYEDMKNFTFVEYDKSTQYRLEVAHQNQETKFAFTNSRGHECAVDFNTMTEYRKNDPNNRTKIQRKLGN